MNPYMNILLSYVIKNMHKNAHIEGRVVMKIMIDKQNFFKIVNAFDFNDNPMDLTGLRIYIWMILKTIRF